ncbi:MAG TPA: HAMP domain-containing protein, partial [Thermoanaerobaculia bacterium]
MKLAVMAGTSIVLVVVLASFAYFGQGRVSTALAHVIRGMSELQTEGAADQANQSIRADVLAAVLAGQQGNISEKPRSLASLAAHVKALKAGLQEIEESSLSSPVKATAKDVRPALENYESIAGALTALAFDNPPEASAKLPEFLRAADTMGAQLNSLNAQITTAATQARADGDAVVSTANHIMLWTALIALLAMAAQSFAISTSITGRLSIAVDAANRLAEGDVSMEITPGADDDIGALLSAMSRMIASLKSLSGAATQIADGDLMAAVTVRSERDVLGNALQRMVQRLSDTMAEVRSSANALSSAAGQVSASAQSLSEGTSQQAASVEETTSSLEEMTASIGQNADSSRQMEQMAKKGARDAEESGLAVSATVQAMNSIAEKVSIIEE